jgi:hypothetical protein
MDPYIELRKLDYAAYVLCVNTASAISINHKLEMPVAAAIEKAMIEQALCFLSPARAF